MGAITEDYSGQKTREQGNRERGNKGTGNEGTREQGTRERGNREQGNKGTREQGVLEAGGFCSPGTEIKAFLSKISIDQTFLIRGKSTGTRMFPFRI
jgi:hypothetical protein